MTGPAAPAAVRVLLFARYADVLGADALSLDLPLPATLAQIVAAVRALPGGHRLPPHPLCAINLEQRAADTLVQPGDEVALLPPLAGG